MLPGHVSAYYSGVSGDHPHDLNELIARAAAIGTQASGDRWEIVRQLHIRTDRATFDAACALARSADANERVLGVDILSQIGYAANRPFHQDTITILLAASEDEQASVVASAIAALGHLADPRGRSAVLRASANASPDVRFAAATALPMVSGDPPEPEVITALTRLTDDENGDVRDWATFGLGSQLDADIEGIRDALATRLHDESGDTAGEALVGLARRHDSRALSPLLASLQTDPGNLIVEAAAELGAREALPALLRLKAHGWGQGADGAVLDQAIAACGSNGHEG